MTKRTEKILETYIIYNSYTETAKILKISRQRVHQVVTNYRNFGRSSTRKRLYLGKFKKICESCNQNNSIALHHKDGDNTNDNINNLISLCHKCHVEKHVELRKKLEKGYRKSKKYNNRRDLNEEEKKYIYKLTFCL